MKKCISLVLALVMALALCTVSWADVTSAKDFPSGGTGSDTVYWTIGTEDGQSGYAATLTAALTAAYKANSDGSKAITIICKPNADVGTMTHGHVADDLTIYGNGAYISGGECDLEVDTFKFSRSTGAQATDGESLTRNITITAYDLDNLGVWGQRNTNHTVTINLINCNGKAIGSTENVQRVYISGTSGKNNITLTNCDFLTAKTAVYSNADGEINVENCSFTGSAAPVNINHKTSGAVTVNVSNCKFNSCGDAGEWKGFAAPIRLVQSDASGSMNAAVDNATFTTTTGTNGDILLGDGRANQESDNTKITATVTNTNANVQAQEPGYYTENGEIVADKVTEAKVKSSEKLTVKPVAEGDGKVALEKETVPSSSNNYYYYSPSTTTTDTTKGSPKTFDAGVGVYAVTAVLSLGGMAWTAKKRH